MPTISHTRRLFFERRVRVDVVSLTFLASELRQKFGLTEVRGVLYVGEEQHSFSGLDDLTATLLGASHNASEVTLHFRSEDWAESVSFYFHRFTIASRDPLRSQISAVEISSTDETRAHLLQSINALYEHKYEDSEPLSDQRFTALGLSDFRAIQSSWLRPTRADNRAHHGATKTKTSTNLSSDNLQLSVIPDKDELSTDITEGKQGRQPVAKKTTWNIVAVLSLVITGAGLVYHRSQAKSADKQTTIAGSAEFSLRSLPQKDDGSVEIQSVTLRNIGKSTATQIIVHCGKPEEQGPAGKISPLASGEEKTFDLQIDSDKNHINHQNDDACRAIPYITYEDATGSYTATFDSAGNAHTLKQADR